MELGRQCKTMLISIVLTSLLPPFELLKLSCNAPATLIGYLPNHGRCAWDPDCPHIPTLVFSAHFVLTRAHLGSTSRSVTHPKTTPGQARLTWEFFPDGLPEKKVHLVDMSTLSFLLRSWAVTYTTPQRNRRPRRPSRNVPLWHTFVRASCRHPTCTSCKPHRPTHTPCNRQGQL